MKKEIKERIEMINKGEVPEGYKETKLGIIPSEWKIEKLNRICEINKDSLSSKTDPNFEFKYYDLSNVNNGIISHPKKTITFENAPSRAKRVFTKNNILMSTVRPYLKGFAFINFQVNNCIASTGFAVIQSEKGLIDYIYQYLFSKKMENQMKRLTVGSNYPALNSKDVNRLKFLIPKKKNETTIIANILQTWDKAIELKEKLLEKKKEIKKGLMQRLLTGKIRLKGFKEDWKEVKLGNVTDVSTGNKDTKDKNDNGKYPFFVRSATIERIDSYSYDGEAILIPGDGKVGEIYHYINGKFDYHQRVYKISDFSNKCLGKFIYSYLNYFFIREAIKFTAKATVDSLRMYMLRDMKIKLPCLEEQKETTDILLKADKSIELLEKEIELLREQKKGLMQLLLTGKVRVNELN